MSTNITELLYNFAMNFFIKAPTLFPSAYIFIKTTNLIELFYVWIGKTNK